MKFYLKPKDIERDVS